MIFIMYVCVRVCVPKPFSIQYQEPLPLADFFVCIDQHFEVLYSYLTICSISYLRRWHTHTHAHTHTHTHTRTSITPFNRSTQARTKLLEVNTKLENRAHQFRIIQKRLLVRFKDRNSSPLGHLDTLMRGTFNKMIDLGNEVHRHIRINVYVGACIHLHPHKIHTYVRQQLSIEMYCMYHVSVCLPGGTMPKKLSSEGVEAVHSDLPDADAHAISLRA